MDTTIGSFSKNGPETITIYKSKIGTYHYYIYNYSEGTTEGRKNSIQGSLINSRANVKIYGSTGLVKSYNVPNSGYGVYWDVFKYNGSTGQITSINKITSSITN